MIFFQKKKALLKSLGFSPSMQSQLIRRGKAMRVVFLFPGEEGGGYVEDVEVFLFDNGMVHIRTQNEETTTHLSNCEILWRYEDGDSNSRVTPLRVVE